MPLQPLYPLKHTQTEKDTHTHTKTNTHTQTHTHKNKSSHRHTHTKNGHTGEYKKYRGRHFCQSFGTREE